MGIDTSGLELGKVSEEISKGAQFAYKEEEKKKAIMAKKPFYIRHKNKIIAAGFLGGVGIALYWGVKKLGEGVKDFTDIFNPAKHLDNIGDAMLKPFSVLEGMFDIKKLESGIMEIVPKASDFDIGSIFKDVSNIASAYRPELDGVMPTPSIDLERINVDLKSIFPANDIFSSFFKEVDESQADVTVTKKWWF